MIVFSTDRLNKENKLNKNYSNVFGLTANHRSIALKSMIIPAIAIFCLFSGCRSDKTDTQDPMEENNRTEKKKVTRYADPPKIPDKPINPSPTAPPVPRSPSVQRPRIPLPEIPVPNVPGQNRIGSPPDIPQPPQLPAPPKIPEKIQPPANNSGTNTQ